MSGQCQHCKHWTRHHPRDQAGFCKRFNNGFAMEDDTCADFDPQDSPAQIGDDTP